MRITVNAKELHEVIKKAEKIIDKRASLGVLKCMQLKADGNTITAQVNNLEGRFGLIMNLDGDIEQPGSVLIHIDNFKPIKKLKSMLDISLDDSTISIKGSRTFSFTNCTDEFPEVNNSFDYEAFTIEENNFKDILKIKQFMSNDEYREALTGFCITGNEAVTCDSYRFAVKNMNINNKCDKKILVPGKAIESLDKLLDKKSGDLLDFNYNIGKTEKHTNYLQIKSSEWTFVTRLMGCEYIDHKNYIPKDFSFIATIDNNILTESIKFASELGDKNSNMPVVFNITDDKFNVSRTCEQQGMEEDIEIYTDKNDNDEFAIAFNPFYIQDILKLIDNDAVTIKFTNNIGIAEYSAREDERYYVVPVRMPARV